MVRLRSALVSCAFAVLTSYSSAQSSVAIKATPPAGVSYSKEDSRPEDSSTLSALARQEADLRAALSQQPDSPSLLYALALVERQEDNPQASLDTYTRAARFRKPTPQELRSVALDYVLLNDYDDAIHWLEAAAAVDRSDADILYALGRCYYSKSRFVDAGKMFDQVLAIRPNDLKAEENLGLVFDATNHPQEAETALRKAVSWSDANGRDEWPFLDLGDFLLDHGRAQEAIPSLQAAARIKPSSAVAHERLGRALVATQQITAGIDELEKSMKLDPKNPRIHFQLGRALRQAGRADEAKKEFALSQQLYAAHSQE